MSSFQLYITLQTAELLHESVAVIVKVAVQSQPLVGVATPPETKTVGVPGQLSVTLPTRVSASAVVGRAALHGSLMGPFGHLENTGGS